ncbi:DNA cytosine methyltransferase [Riemerella anatipestifer]|nr:DNA cytosine methyltransferase [Riemerella anatipestifer]
MNGNCLIQSGFYPKTESGYTLSDILQTEVPQEYFLSEKIGELFNKAKRYKREEREWFQATNFSGTITNNGLCRNTDAYVKVGTWRTHKDGNDLRRFTEIECERLQGFPDDWTRYGNYDGKIQEISKSQRYKMIGNAVTVDVVAEIGKRLKITYH